MEGRVSPVPKWEDEAHLLLGVNLGFKEIGHRASDTKFYFYYALSWFLLPVFALSY